MQTNMVDVVIAGGGPAGLSAALVLGRADRSVALIDNGKARNHVTKASHGFLTRDGIDPLELKKIARDQMKKYPNVHFQDETVISVQKEKNIFTTVTASGQIFTSRKVIFSTGMTDHLPDIPGIHDVYGKTVFHCPYCDGWERRGEPLAVFGDADGVVDFTKIIFNWSRDLIVFTNGQGKLSEQNKQELLARGIAANETPIAKLASNKGKLTHVYLKDGTSVARSGGFMVHTGEKQASFIPGQLGVKMTEQGSYETNEHGQTDVEGLFVIGDAKNTFVSVVGAAGQGYEAGVYINNLLSDDDWDSGISL